MNLIIKKNELSSVVTEFVVDAPLIARAAFAGHFVIVRADENSERIPLTIAVADKTKGTITLIIQKIGYSTKKLCNLNEGDFICDIAGPLGKSTRIENFGTVICACGGLGAAPMLPIATALKAAGNRVITILAARTKELIILEEQMRKVSDKVLIYTDDGSYGTKGLVTNGIEEIILLEKVERCEAIGPAIMMKFVCLLTKKHNIPTEVSLNTIMVDGTGMCGACRVSIDGETKFVCIDGPEFDGHKVNFDEMIMRLK
jgi:glutamate synthase (NADPH/NADH) small chain